MIDDIKMKLNIPIEIKRLYIYTNFEEFKVRSNEHRKENQWAWR